MGKIKFEEVQGMSLSSIAKAGEDEREKNSPFRWEDGIFSVGELDADKDGYAFVPITKYDELGEVAWTKKAQANYILPFSMVTRDITKGVHSNQLNGIDSLGSEILKAIEDGKKFEAKVTKEGFTVNGAQLPENAPLDPDNIVMGSKRFKSQGGIILNVIVK